MDAIARFRRELRRQYRELHEAVARDHAARVSGQYAATGETDALADEFANILPDLATRALGHAQTLGIAGVLEPIVNDLVDHQRRLYQLARDAVFQHAPGLPQTLDSYFPALERLDRAMMAAAPAPAQPLADLQAPAPAQPLADLQRLILDALAEREPQRRAELMATLNIGSTKTLHGCERNPGLSDLVHRGLVTHSRAGGGYRLSPRKGT